jgi:putative ABC transport system permease protein
MDKLLYHLRFSFRVFLKDKFFSALNILGLSMGIAVGIILVLILKNDLTYDQHYSKHRNIYRLGAHYVIPDVDMMTGLTARELGPILKSHYPEIGQMVRVSKRDLGHQLVKAEGKAFYEENIAETDSGYFAVFNHDFVHGDVNTCLDDPNNVVLTETMAKKYFGEESAIDKLLTIGRKIKKVSAVIADHPENTDLKFDFLLAGLPEIRPTWEQTFENGKPITLVFWNPDSYTFLVLPDNYDPDNFYNRFQPIFDEYFAGLGDGLVNTPVLQRLDEIHFSGVEGETQGNVRYLLALSGIGLLIIILACINYMNLSTAKAIKRSTEITIKRLSGSGRRALVLSLIGESILMSLISLVVAVGIVYIVLDLTSFETLIGKHLTFDLFNAPGIVMAALVLAILIGILSGIYPAFYLTGIPVIAALKGRFKTGRTGLFMRKTLITFQFCVSMFVVLVTIFMSSQLEFARTKDLGFDRNNLLVVPLQDTATRRKIEVITNDMTTDPRIVSASVSGQVVGTGTGGEQMMLEGEKGMEQKRAQSLYVGEDYLETVGLKLIAGRDFYKGRDDEEAYIVNESLVKMMGWGDKAIGKKMTFYMGHHPGTVVGVIRDFNIGSLREQIEPLCMIKGHWSPGFLHLRLSGDDIPAVVEHVRQKWSAIEPEHPFEYFFIDQKYDEQYKADITQKTLLTVLSYVCITISLLGLLGLSAFTAVQRTKEIGVRKVLGASVPGILLLLSKDILLLVIVAALVAVPVSWFVIDTWLQGFAYRAPFNYLLYAITLLAALVFVLLITAFQSLKTATANPVDSLKHE